MKLNKILAISLLGLSCFGLVSCGNEDNSNNGGNGSQTVQKQITLTVTGATKTVVGQSVKLKISVKNDSTKSGYSVESSDETVATISETGLINALSAGTTTITIASKADSSVKKEFVFTVMSAEDVGVKIVADKTSVKVGETINLSANVTNKDDDEVTYKWSCENYSGSFDKTNGKTAKFTTDSAGKEVIKLTATIGEVEVTDQVEIEITESLDKYVKISTADEFKSKILAKNTIKDDFILTADIDLGGMEINGNADIRKLAGTLDGRGHKVSNFSIISSENNTAGHNNSGMFQEVSGTIKNLEVDGTLTENSLGWGTAILTNILSGTVENCLFNSVQSFNNGSDTWFAFGASICGVLKESAIVKSSVVNVSGEGKDVHMAICAYPAGGSVNDGTNKNFAPSKQTFTVSGIYTNQSLDLACGSAWEWGGPIEDTSGIHTDVDFSTAKATTYSDLSANYWNLADNTMPTLKTLAVE